MTEPDPVAVAVESALTPTVAEADAEVCGHCRAPINAPSYGTASDGTPLCHTGTIPPSANPADCYRLVTVYGHDPDGTCCLARPEPPWDLLAAPEGFAGCARRCRKTGMHTLTWGECEWAPEPEPKDPEFGWWRTVEMDDGLPSIAMVSVPLLAVLPWAAHLAVEERHRMLDESATALDPAVCFERWRQDAVARETAEQTPPGGMIDQ